MSADLEIGPAELDRLRGEYDVVPLVRRLSADTLTPVSAFAVIAGNGEEAFLLESVERGESVGRYSFLGVQPRRRMRFDRGIDSPVPTLREELSPLKVWRAESLPPFFGGAVGWFGYGVAGWSETLPDRHESDSSPDAELLFFDNVIAFDHVRQEVILVANLTSRDERTSEELLAVAADWLNRAQSALGRARVDLLTIPESPSDVAFRQNMSREQFSDAVGRARAHIKAGDVFQVVISQQWETSVKEEDALTLYRVLRSRNPSPYMFLLRTSDCTLVGTSPEMLVRIDGGRRVETRPIAGTRPRSSDSATDAHLEEELRNDAKERAEHLMLVDLGRNDVGRIAERGSVEVTRFAEVERYSHVMHLVSDVRGTVPRGVPAIDVLLAAFPAGTVTGAPKIRAMQLIDELEPARRGPYAGAIAYFGFGGTLDSCIAIRTIVIRDGKATIQAGAGIVYDSVAEREYEECVNKSAALRNAVGLTAAIVEASA